ncbi:MAG: Rieske 2Fe-2S domain-containing protein [Planctomycetes bacterium]|nr:Rieske 2Fe-2S domain-containing protein [Planctomycetota bacterium]
MSEAETGVPSVRPDRSEQKAEAWRQAYPIDTGTEQLENRRQFLKTIVATSAVIACGQFALLAAAERRIRTVVLSDQRLLLDIQLSDLEVGGAAVFNYPNEHSPCVIARLPDENNTAKLVAYSQRCTHLACPVVPDVAAGKMVCPCHNGAFDINNGHVLYGPPKDALPRLKLEVADSGMIYVLGMEQDR